MMGTDSNRRNGAFFLFKPNQQDIIFNVTLHKVLPIPLKGVGAKIGRDSSSLFQQFQNREDLAQPG